MMSPFAQMSMTVKNTFLDFDEPPQHGDARRRASSAPPAATRREEAGPDAEVAVAQLQRLDAIVQLGAKPARLDSKVMSPSARWSSYGDDDESTTVGGSPMSAASDMGDLSPSLGSAGHAAGTCRPCAFARSSSGCKFGTSCNFCHLITEHPESVRMRPCKGKRERFKRTMAVIEEKVAQNPDLLCRGDLSLPSFVDRNPQARARVMAHLSQVAADAYRGMNGGVQRNS